jgi:hypothetical protein
MNDTAAHAAHSAAGDLAPRIASDRPGRYDFGRLPRQGAHT